jgi:hypothetical protein
VLTGRQLLRVVGVALCGTLLVYAAWITLGDEPRAPRARVTTRRTSAATRASEARSPAPLAGLEEPSILTPADAGPLSTSRSSGSTIIDLSPTPTWFSGPDPSEPGDAGLTPGTHAPPPPPTASNPPATSALSTRHPGADALLAAAPATDPSLSQPPPAPSTPGETASDESSPPVQRHLVQVIVTRWQQPGLCPVGSTAAATRNALLLQFRRLYWDNGASLFLDPRLSNGIQERLTTQLEAAEASVREQLQLTAPRPNVFAYADTRLLLAASCSNEDVVAYYDGAIHLVPTRPDLAQSTLHEYTHHALISSGLVGPAWAQEGIAMTVANETWWRQPSWLERVAEKPFSIESMEQLVPYTLSSDQASLFYVQAAAMVTCALQNEEGGLAGLVRSLRRSRGAVLSYTLPGLADPRSFRICANELMR